MHPKCRGTAQDCVDNQGGCFSTEEFVFWGECYEVSAAWVPPKCTLGWHGLNWQATRHGRHTCTLTAYLASCRLSLEGDLCLDHTWCGVISISLAKTAWSS